MSENFKNTNAEETLSQSDSPATSKKLLSFSIERILANDYKRRPTDSACASLSVRDPYNASAVHLPWLSYTRYSPPKLPRAKRRKCSKRKSNGNPRVPFSTSQLMTLEHKYLETRYLSSPEVLELSTALGLSEHRVKIWFQNRRAREKKSQSSCNVKGVSSIAFPAVLDRGKCLMPAWFGRV